MNYADLGLKAKSLNRYLNIQFEKAWNSNRAAVLAAAGFVLLVLIYSIFSNSSSNTTIFDEEKNIDFSKGRILGSNNESFYKGKESVLNQTTRDVLDKQSEVLAKLKALEGKLENLKTKTEEQDKTTQTEVTRETMAPPPPLTSHPGDPNLAAEAISNGTNDNQKQNAEAKPKVKKKAFRSFPVRRAKKKAPVKTGPVIPTGAYSLGTALTGIDTPDKRVDPVLIELDHEFVGPNGSRMDLTGCFMIAKATPSRSTERVDYQATKLSCVNSSGEFFERKINGFIQSNTDHVLGIEAEVRSRQNRVAAMAFLSSVVQGVGQALQQAQTTQQTNPLGGSQSVITGNQGKYILGGGASSAAGRVADWYLKEASQLLPTFRVNAGEKVWIVLKDKVSLPKEFFGLKKKVKNGGESELFNYFTKYSH